MVYLKPPRFTRRVVNPVVSRLRTGGVEQLTVVGRRTGRPCHVPVIPVRLGQQRYLVSPFGESDWVRNLRAAGGGELHGHRRRESFVAQEVPVDQRIEVIDAYRRVVGRSVERCFRSLPDPGDHPVFVIEHPFDETPA